MTSGASTFGPGYHRRRKLLREAQSSARVAAARPKRRPKGTGTSVQRTCSIKAGEAATVVVVDDDPSVLRALSRLIQAAGFRVLTFDRPSALLASALPRVNACMVVDINLPEMAGSELCSALASIRPRTACHIDHRPKRPGDTTPYRESARCYGAVQADRRAGPIRRYRARARSF